MVTKENRYKQVLLELRREKVLKLTSRGYSQRDIAKELNVSPALVNNDIKFLKETAVSSIQHYVSTILPVEMEHSLIRLKDIIKKAFEDIDNPNTSTKDRHNAMLIIKECSALRLEIMGSGVLADQLNRTKTGVLTNELNKDKNNNIKNETRIKSN